jgi:hypothetical protein
MKYLYSFILLILLSDSFAGNFRSTTNSNTAQQVSPLKTTINRFAVLNTSTDTIYVKIYDIATAPTSANTPTMTLQCYPKSQIFNSQNYSSTPVFTNGCFIRTVKGSADNNAVSPSQSPIIEINFSN